MTFKQTAFLVAFCVAAIPVGISTYRARRWIWRYFHDAPLVLRISAGVAPFALVVSLLSGFQSATEAITWVMVASIVVAALWGRWRYGDSPRRQRWDATWASVESALPANPEEADRLVAEGQREDDREREALRVRAATDLGAARAFLRASERELSELESLSRRHPEAVAVVARLRARLEADCAWARTVVQGVNGPSDR